mgnify:CR=1 FL=1
MRMIDIIEHKKQGLKLTKEEIEFFVSGFTSGKIPDYQASALAMAIYFNKMSDEETSVLTNAMAKSGDMLDLSLFGNLSVDKHSSGGVGDKTTLVVAPIAAALGCVVAKMSGRGLGFTGGTIDKLESIPNFNTQMSPQEFINQAKDIGIVVAGQTGNMAPCDKKLYALRDVTATVDCMPLIASSIMSKKLAAGSKNIVLDVKCGDGAFMKSKEDATHLANEMIKIGTALGRNVSAVISDMNSPLGFAVGNTLEVVEAVKILKGEKVPRLYELCITLASHMVSSCKGISLDSAKEQCEAAIENGSALQKLCDLVKAQGGDESYIKDESKFPLAKYKYEIKAEKDGYISLLEAEKIGNASCLLGAGRSVKDDKIDTLAGIVLSVKVGDKINKSDTVMTLYSSSEEKIKNALSTALSSIKISDKKVKEQNVIIDEKN